MEIQDRHIVAIDLGTSKIALTVAKVNGENVQIVYYRETPSEGIRYSSVFNASVRFPKPSDRRRRHSE